MSGSAGTVTHAAAPVYSPAAGGRRRATRPASRTRPLVALVLVSILVAYLGRSAEMPTLFMTGLGFLVLAVLLSPVLGLWLVVASIPFSEVGFHVAGGFTLTVALGGLALFSWAVHVMLGRRRLERSRSPMLFLAFGFVVSLTLSGLLGGVSGVGNVLTFVQLAILLVLVSQLLTDEREVEKLMVVWIAVMAFVQASALLGFDVRNVGRANRLAGVVVNANLLSYYSIVAFWLATHFALRPGRLAVRLAFLAALVLGALSVGLSVSRTGILVLGMTLALAVWPLRMPFARNLFWLAVAVGSLAAVSRGLDWTAAYQEVEGVTAIVEGGTSRASTAWDNRLFLMRSWLQQWQKRPVLGLGPMATASGGRVLKVNVPHNTYVSVLVETGIAGLVWFLALLYRAMRTLVLAGTRAGPGASPTLGRVWLLGLLGMLLMSISNSFEYNKVTWMILGVAVALHRIRADQGRAQARRALPVVAASG